jgi:hypothetical protein
MSKPWFLKIALDAEPSPLAGVISNILQTSTIKNDSASSKPLPPLPDVTPTDARPTAIVDFPEKPQQPTSMLNGHRDMSNGAEGEV